ncbi:hypothetical protein EB796_012391 [Bugula neritina]|uniref:C2H2-type domain-containing protein n=1 Tax=Bugula neritina TaxID=10212 RepID=A0A7J7JTT3_BUGNE|nr:hypothetical protein EB796_012391 [Bugula neritina]
MADILSEKDVVLLYQAIAFGKASKLAQLRKKPSEVENGQPTSNEQSPIFNKEVPRVNLAGQRLNPKEETTPAETIVFHQKPRSTEISENISLAAKLHSMNVEANFTMNPCNSISERKGKSRKALPRHADTSLSEPKFTCEKCGYQTKRKDHYKRHCLTHTGDRPFKCHLCTFSSVDKYHLVRHLKSSMHSNGGNRSRSSQLECESCDYKTHQLGRMERHKRTHSGEKPFACSYCAYKAAQRATLDRHLLTHTGEKPFSCDKCDYFCS